MGIRIIRGSSVYLQTKVRNIDGDLASATGGVKVTIEGPTKAIPAASQPAASSSGVGEYTYAWLSSSDSPLGEHRYEIKASGVNESKEDGFFTLVDQISTG